MIPVINENAKLKLLLAATLSAPITVANNAIETRPLVADKTIKPLEKQWKTVIYLLSQILDKTLSRISAIT